MRGKTTACSILKKKDKTWLVKEQEETVHFYRAIPIKYSTVLKANT